MMKTKNLLTALATTTALAAGSANAAVLSVPNFTLTPNGTSDSPVQTYDIAGGVSANSIVKSTDPVAYIVTTFTFGAGTLADLQMNFAASAGQDRLGFKATDDGLIQSYGDGSTKTLNLGSSLAGTSVTILAKFEFDANYSTTYGRANASEDTFATFWINPTGSETEGSGRPDGADGVANANFTGDLASNLWNSSAFFLLESRIFNNSTAGGNGDSIIQNTTLLTGSDATFANALALATIPEPSSLALMGLGGLLIARRRRA